MFNYQGVFTRSQWNVVKGEAIWQKGDITLRKLHLQQEITRLKTLRKKLFKADNALSGTSLKGSEGDGLIANTIVSEGTTDAQAVIAELTPLNPPNTFGTYIPTVCGGDKPWLDDPVYPKKLVSSYGGANDADNTLIIEDLKFWMLQQIKRQYEKTEFKLKKICDLIEQLQKEITLLDSILVSLPTDQYNPYIEGRVQAIESRFTNFVYKDKTLFETAIYTRVFPSVSDTSTNTGDVGEPKVSIDQDTAKINSEVQAETTAKPTTKGYGFPGG